MSALLMLPLKPKLNVIIAANDNNERGFISDAYTLSWAPLPRKPGVAMPVDPIASIQVGVRRENSGGAKVREDDT